MMNTSRVGLLVIGLLTLASLAGCSDKIESTSADMVEATDDLVETLNGVATNTAFVEAKADIETQAAKVRDCRQAFNLAVQNTKAGDETLAKSLEAVVPKLDDAQKRLKAAVVDFSKRLGPQASRQLFQIMGDLASNAGGQSTSSGDTEAEDALLLAEATQFAHDQFAERYLESDGAMTTQMPVDLTSGESWEYTYLLQIKSPDFKIRPRRLDKAEKLNGIEFIGEIVLNEGAQRTYGEPQGRQSMNDFEKQPKQWSSWQDTSAYINISKIKGQWQVEKGKRMEMGDWGSTVEKEYMPRLLRGRKPASVPNG